jgi:hypothetical protein
VEIKDDPNAPRGPGAARFNRMLRQKAPEKLQEGRHMVYEHALRCLCKMCGSLLNWDCPQDVSYTQTTCCGLDYRLQPRTVIVHVEDVSARPILPQMKGSDYSDPEFRFSDDLFIGKNAEPPVKTVGGLSKAQLSLRHPNPPESLVVEPVARKVGPTPRKCGICRQPGHTRRKCPER